MARCGSSYEALCIAIRRNWTETVEKILNQPGGLVIDDTWSDYLLLVRALHRRERDIVKLLLIYGCRVNTTVNTYIFCTPLYYAVKYRDYELIKLLLNSGALINGKDFNQESSLCLALKTKNNDIIDIIMSKYCTQIKNRNCDSDDDYYALTAACLNNNLNVIERLIEHGININKLLHFELEDEPDCTALHYAVKTVNYELIDLLLANGASVNIKDANEQTPLHLALYIKGRHPNSMSRHKVMQKLLDIFRNLKDNVIDKNGVSHFHIACTSDACVIDEQLLKKGVNINTQIKSISPAYPGYTPLHLAIEYKNQSIVRLLLNHGAQTTIQNADSHTPLHLAFFVLQSDHNFINLILKYVPTNINSANKYGLTHLHIAAAMNEVTVIKKFIEAGFDINIQVHSDSQKCPGYTPLHFAVAFNQKEAVECLLQNDANVNVRAEAGFTPLHLACQQDAKKVNYLIRKSIHNTETGLCMCFEEDSYINAFQKRSKEILFYMDTQEDQIEIVDLLLKYNSNVDSQDDDGRTPLFHAYDIDRNTFRCKFRIICNDQEELQHVASIFNKICQRRDKILEILFKYKPNLHIYDKNGNNILHYVAGLVSQHHDGELEKIAEKLIKSGVDLNIKNRFGSNPLHIATKKGFYSMARIFIEYNVDINESESRMLRTPLHLCVLDTLLPPVNDSIIAALVQKGADINIRMIDGRTPLHIAASKRSSSSNLAIMLEANGDVELQDTNGRTALHLACINRNSGNVNLLLEYGADINILDDDGKTAFYYFYEYQTNLLKFVDVANRQLSVIYNFFQNHITRLRFINFPVSNENMVYYTELRDSLMRSGLIHYLDKKFVPPGKLYTEEDVIKRCQVELEHLKLLRISVYSTMYDMLFKDLNKITLYVDNEKFHRNLQSKTFSEDFMLYGFLLKLQLKRGLERSEILVRARKAMENLLDKELPDEVLDPILKYLNNNDLKNIIMAEDVILPKSTSTSSNE